MPRVTLVYSVSGYVFREYEVPQEIINQGAGVVDEYVSDRDIDPLFERDNTELNLESL